MDTGKEVSVVEIRQVTDLLGRAYPYIEETKRKEGVFTDSPLDSLVRTILSQNTSDINRDRAFARLKARYPAWDNVTRAPTEELAEAVRETNYAYTKAGRIQGILDRLREEHGRITLDFLREWPTERIVDYLQSFPGVGEKSAAIVCLFSLRRPVMPVDTHVHRVTQRLGWIGPKTSPERAHRLLRELIPDALIFPLHIGLWEHGHTTCRPRPRCAQCVVYRFCLYAGKTAPEPTIEEALEALRQQKRKVA